MEETLISVLPVLATGVIAPLVVAILKKVIPGLPKWLLPLISVAGPTIVDTIAAAIESSLVGSPLLAAIGGAMGIGLREIYDQVRKNVLL